MKEPVDHILRPQLPWRDDPPITECGYNAGTVRTITREEFATRIKDYGAQRTAMITCMTCSETSKRHGTWEDDPRQAIGREVDWECGWRRRDANGVRLRDELLAIANLIANHRTEFDDLITGMEARREWLEKKKVRDARPKMRSAGKPL